jgi:phosphomannomutase/phosphoglucomutase
MHSSIFKVYDIRGVVGSELLPEKTYQLGQALAWYFKETCPHVTTIAIGRDGRTHSQALCDETIRAFIDSGINIIDLGVCSTPIVYFAQEKLPVHGGIMITASHNPPQYNGFKLILDKHLVHSNQIQQIKAAYEAEKKITPLLPGTLIKQSLTNEYVYFMVDQFPHLLGSDIHAVIDCANGATGAIIPQLIKKFDWKNVRTIYDTVSGTPHHQADPTKEQNVIDLKQALSTSPQSCGIAFDGDGDRMGAITEQGTLLHGDELGALFCSHIKKRVDSCTVVTDVISSHVLRNWMEHAGITCITSRVGHAFIKEAMAQNNAVFGSELSCHFCFADSYFGYDDGIYAMLRLFEIIITTQQSLQTHYEQLPKRSNFAIRIPYEPSQKDTIIAAVTTHFTEKQEYRISTLDGVCAEDACGWGLIRPSNTEPVLSLHFEGNSHARLETIKRDFYNALRKTMDGHAVKQALDLP